ncbi:MAG: flagellar motor switch protein FliM [bacterium]
MGNDQPELDEGPQPGSGQGTAQPYSFTHSDQIIRGRMPTLEIIHDRFVRHFRLTLSSALRLVTDIDVHSTQLIKFGDFLKALPIPSSLNLFRMAPLRGNAIMILETPLVFSLLDMFFGGDGKKRVRAEGRDFSAIEQRMVKRVVVSALEDLQASWRPVFPVQVSYSRSEVNPQFVAIVPHSEVVVVVKFQVDFGVGDRFMSICLPYSMLEPLRPLLHSGFQSDQSVPDSLWASRFNRNLEKTSQRLVAQVAGKEMTVRQLLSLNKGQVLMTNNKAEPEATLNLNGMPKFKGVLRNKRVVREVSIDQAMEAPPNEELARLFDQARALAEEKNRQ